jgi:hypothetical protein
MSVQSTAVLDKTFKAAGDLTTKLFHAVRFSADYTVDASSAATQVGAGILQNEPGAAGRGARVRMLGTSVGVAGAAFAAGAKLTVNAAGRLITAAGGNQVYAIACQAALADGDQVEVFVCLGAIA